MLLHSLSHALMAEIALDCAYPASSLKERVYALSGPDGAPERCGILIYTATAGAQGTLGGLVGTAPRFAQILESALERSPSRFVVRSTPYRQAARGGCTKVVEPSARYGISERR